MQGTANPRTAVRFRFRPPAAQAPEKETERAPGNAGHFTARKGGLCSCLDDAIDMRAVHVRVAQDHRVSLVAADPLDGRQVDNSLGDSVITGRTARATGWSSAGSPSLLGTDAVPALPVAAAHAS
jgi:hypothetical protein